MWKSMLGIKTIESSLKVAPLISSEMEKAIATWAAMYGNKAPWLHEPDEIDPVRIVSLGLPAMIASEKARMALIEWQSEITTPTEEVEVENPNYTEPMPDEFGNILPITEPATIKEEQPVGDTTRAEYLNKQYEKLKRRLRIQLEYGIAKGGFVIKPYLVFNKVGTEGQEQEEEQAIADIEFEFIQADNFYPLAFDASGDITEAAFVQIIQDKETTYYRLEYHKFKGNSVEITNKAYKRTGRYLSDNDIDLGQEISLTEVPQWKDLQPKTVIKNVSKPLFAYFKMPIANTVDTLSPLGVSGYSSAVSLIKDADMQYSRLLWEYEAGEMAIDIDRDALKFMEEGNDGSGHSVMTKMQQRLYRKVDIAADGETFITHSPALRDSSYIQGLNTILMRIEDVCAISRGTLSDGATEARTATELKILKQKNYQANLDIQHELEAILRDVIYIMNVYCDLYELTPDGEYDVSFEWDDSILVDVEQELNKKLTLMQQGLMSKLEVRQWYFGETERQAQEALATVDEENAKAAEADLIMQSNMNKEE